MAPRATDEYAAAGPVSGVVAPSRTDVGVTQTDAIHFFDLFAHLLGREATEVAAVQRDFRRWDSLGYGLLRAEWEAQAHG